MANNRVWIQCTECNRKKALLKFYPSTGWYSKGNTMRDINDFLEWHKHDRVSNFGENDFQFVYETDPDFKLMQADLEESKGESNGNA